MYRLICILLSALLFSSELNIALCTEPKEVIWVMEKWEMDETYSPLSDFNVEKHKTKLIARVIKKYDISSGNVAEVEIPIEWIPVTNPLDTHGLFFYTQSKSIEGFYSIDVLCWNSEQYTIVDTFELQEGDTVIQYVEGLLLVQDYNKNLCVVQKDERLLYEGKDPFAYTMFGGEMLIGITKGYTTSTQESFVLSQLSMEKIETQTEIQNVSWYEFEPYSKVNGICPMRGENSLSIWQPLDYQYIRSTVLYLHDEFTEKVEPHITPLHHVEQLQTISLSDNCLRPYLDQETRTKDIRIVDLIPICTVAYEEKLICLCYDYSPAYIAGNEQDEVSYEGRTLILCIDLWSGEQYVIYETGYNKPDYSLIWEYLMEKYGTINWVNLTSNEYLAELSKKLHNSQFEIPLNTQKNGVMEFFVDSFDVLIQ